MSNSVCTFRGQSPLGSPFMPLTMRFPRVYNWYEKVRVENLLRRKHHAYSIKWSVE